MKLLNKVLRYALIAGLYCTHNSPFVLANHTHFNNVGFPSNSRYDSSPTSLFSDSPKTIEPLHDYRSDANLPKESYNNSDEEHNDEFKDEQRHSERHSDGCDYDHDVNTDDQPPFDTPPKVTVASHIVERTELPKDNDTWWSIQEGRKIYVDKTKFLLHFVDKESKLYFSCKPPRFGKTSFLQMLKSYFLGEKELFKGLYVFDIGNTPAKNGTWIKYPVITITFSDIDIREKYNSSASEIMSGIEEDIEKILRLVASEHGIGTTEYRSFSLGNLISELYLKYRLPLVVLIDEYDSVINDAINISEELSKKLPRFLNNFYVKIKAANDDNEIKLAWVTGVHNYEISYSENGPNSFTRLSWDSTFATSVGFTKHEIETTFKHKISEFAARENKTFDDIMNEMTFWYGGYNFGKNIFDTKNNVYNPVSVINALREFKFAPYWSDTRTSKRIVKEMYEYCYDVEHFDNLTLYEVDLNRKHDARNKIALTHYMLYAGYLRIISYNKKEHRNTLNYPNNEMKAFLKNEIDEFVPGSTKKISQQHDIEKKIKTYSSLVMN